MATRSQKYFAVARIDGVMPAGQIVVEMMERAHRVLSNPHGLDVDSEEDERG